MAMETLTHLDISDTAAIEIPDGHISQAYLDVQRTLDLFVEVGYEAAVDAYWQTRSMNGDGATMSVSNGAIYPKQQILDLLATNPPLLSVPRYYADGRENYLWYSDFYDDATKECFVRYGKFIPVGATITPANYAQELVNVDLPYFKELVKLVCLIKLVEYIEARQPQKAAPAPSPIPVSSSTVEPSEKLSTDIKSPKTLRSYEPKLTPAQYALLVKCLNRFEMFRSNVEVTILRELFGGKKTHLLQVTNQRTLTYIFDKLSENKLIKKGWITVATHNGNFISGPRRSAETSATSNPHYITAQQFSNCRLSNQYKYVEHMDDINEAVEQIIGE